MQYIDVLGDSILSIDATYFFSTLLKGIIRKEFQSFTNHGHDKTPPAVFNPLSPWLTLPRDMGVSHTLWPPSITRAILACLWFAQYDVQGDSMYSFLSIDATYFSILLKHPVICNDKDKRRYAGGKTFLGAGFIFKDYLVSVKK